MRKSLHAAMMLAACAGIAAAHDAIESEPTKGPADPVKSKRSQRRAEAKRARKAAKRAAQAQAKGE